MNRKIILLFNENHRHTKRHHQQILNSIELLQFSVNAQIARGMRLILNIEALSLCALYVPKAEPIRSSWKQSKFDRSSSNFMNLCA